ncbi:MAG: PAS domain S-box protein [Nitrospiraceae bacterium]|nr:MAG: PAS domain S-box protein [Nitrospiraceae bacterium]
MEKAAKLNEAFHNFTEASKNLQTYYEKLREKVQYLTQELEQKNIQLNRAVLEVGESKDYLQAVLQSIGEAIIVLDQNDRVTMLNRAAEDLLGSNKQDLTGITFNDLPFNIEENSSGTRLTVKGEEYDVIISRSTVSGPECSVRGYVILIKDITRIKELERQHERNQRLISMGEMAAKIVHEIRSPLCSIELFSTMLSNDLRDTAHSDMANGISTGIKSLNNILTNMLFFAKPQRPAFTDVELADAITDSVNMLMPLIQIRGIKLNQNTTRIIVRSDMELLKQVFMNIILNAVQAMPGGGSLEIATDINNEYVTVSVIDDGEGISPEYIEKIFDPFFSTKDKGTGLGLAIAHKIMQTHGGFIRASRNQGKGSTFCVSFPNINIDKNSDNVSKTFYEKAGK